ncbi:MAG: hypothetical protein Q4D80_07030, partial [Pseudomonadota bacterium]|nr:hypothetical protein [Pseudomonadota bacterium]
MRYLIATLILVLPAVGQAFVFGEVKTQRENSLGETEYRDSMGNLVGQARQNSLGETEYRD